MSIKVFLEIVEIRTKLASLFPFLVGVLFSIAYFNQVSWAHTVLFFVGMVVFDMATTAINNYMDFHKAKSEAYKYQENIIGVSGVSPVLVRNMIFVMIGFTAVIGVILTIQTGWLLLLMGGLCCLIGIFYTFGPIPLSRMPLGEVFSGVTMGLGIFAMTVYLNVGENPPFYLALSFIKGTFALTGNIWQTLAVVWAALPLVLTIANIMLANNLRDLDTDIENHRYTLVYYIGRKKGVLLFQLMQLFCYGIILFGMIFGVYDWPILLVLFSFPKIRKNLQQFKKELPQPKSFRFSISNLILFNGSYVIGLLGMIILKKFS
ncbi:1,4-dihydroxy-2-naphthoate polyprenyltransferase [uncultured Enterococcus sp.]|uniref:1,4-dihydroxy-2-naphthoate polyprenyltransferase n=1 Tax=uncultured Enterococcus sp. TaxID=167972 RepID=UPI002AA89533|nr:1,4-dihydroxy-2-naphthoate polyprenyltransferase [uncultured Enterococcus sp.]